ncbi:phosphoglycerate kinase [Pestalotiopsis sp. IQ-011]
MSNTTPFKIPVESENMVELEQRTENLKSQIPSVSKDLNKGASSLSSTSSSSLTRIEATLESLAGLYCDERSPGFVSLVLRMVKKRSKAKAQSSSTIYPCIAESQALR